MRKGLSSDSQARAMAHIRQLCCLGLGPQATAPPLTRLLLRLIPGLSVTFFFTDANGELVNVYDEHPGTAQVAPLYVSEFYRKREADVTISIAEVFRRGLVGIPFDQILKVDRRTWQRSDMYNLILRPVGYCDGVQVAVRERGRPLAVVKISRGAGAPDFATRDLPSLAALEPHLAHAFASPPNVASLVESDGEENQGLIIADRDGRMQYLSPHARVLLFYSTHPEIARGKVRAGVKPRLPPAVAGLARMLAQTYEGGAPPTPPVHFHENAWGRFAFRAYWLDGLGAEPPLVGIRISRQEPLAVRLLRRMEHLPLSERQIAVSLHMASGLTYEAIAERLGISRSTAIFHAQEVFNKLGVASRAELQAKLMGL